MKTKKITAIILSIVLILSISACDGGGDNPYYFNYSYGSYDGEDFSYKITYRISRGDDGEVFFTAFGTDDIDKFGEVDGEVLSAIGKIIEKHNIRQWHGFYESDNDVSEGFYFSMDAAFYAPSVAPENRRLTASGFESYPPAFDEGHKALADYLAEFADSVPELERKPEPPPLEITYETIAFGGYDWRVLDEQDSKTLVISEKILERRDYHNESVYSVTWKDCDLRAYLNGEFYNSFSADDRARIIPITNENPRHYPESESTADTQDYIFLLSADELVKYFGDSGEYETVGYDLGTDYHTMSDSYNKNRIAYEMNGSAREWWLRSPGISSRAAMVVHRDGVLNVTGGYYGISDILPNSDYGVRPAMWITVE